MIETHTLKNLTPEAFLALGAEDTIYIRPIVQNGVLAFSVHTGAGQPIGLLASADHAQAAALQHDMTLVSVH
ncbi:DUF1150 family protein [Iodidimonas sp. SYSU 1G8]|jgi:hypothetical protein|uniref:DUF1150 family protein n=1 Tax=Iodidimonas sp. SYSU 1G8 TaxID=3133967 RepID=UPI0031FF0218